MHVRHSIGWVPAQPTPLDPDLDERIDRLSDFCRGRRVVALTGAGISTDSGIPDYRSPGAPARTPMTADMFASSAGFRRHYWARNHLGWRHMDAALPNSGHRALTDLQAGGVLTGVITQNVDMLHTKARTSRVVELHGCYGRVRCLSCDWQISRHRYGDLLEAANPGFTERVHGRGAIEVAPDADASLEDTADFVVVACPECDGICKPDIVYFGENVPPSRVEQAYDLVDDADVVLVVGSSLSVMSGLRFVRRARRDGKSVAIVNRGVTRGDDLADLKIDHWCGQVLPRLVDAIGAGSAGRAGAAELPSSSAASTQTTTRSSAWTTGRRNSGGRSAVDRPSMVRISSEP